MSSRLQPNFAALVASAGDGMRPYPYQCRLAGQGLPDVLRVPTGTGKTMAATLPWLYRRLCHPDEEVRRTTPRWLVLVLPQRALVEQTVTVDATIGPALSGRGTGAHRECAGCTRRSCGDQRRTGGRGH